VLLHLGTKKYLVGNQGPRFDDLKVKIDN